MIGTVNDPSDTMLGPRTGLPKGFLDSPNNGVDLQTAPPMLELRVETKNTTYRMIAAGQGNVHIEGGSYFPTLTAACIDGASADGQMVKRGWVVVGLCMEITFNGQHIATSPVRSILSTLPGEEPGGNQDGPAV
jgi:hypothetical protein